MARFVCSARVLDSFVRRTLGIDHAGVTWAVSQNPKARSARPLSTRARDQFRQSTALSLHVEASTSNKASTDSFVPIVSTASASDSDALSSVEPQGWPAPSNARPASQGCEDESDPLVDEEALQQLLLGGLERNAEDANASNHRHSHAGAGFEGGAGNPSPLAEPSEESEMQRQVAVSTEGTAHQENETTPPSSRIINRKARKLRRLEAKLEAARAALTESSAVQDKTGPAKTACSEADEIERLEGHAAGQLDGEALEIKSILQDRTHLELRQNAASERRGKLAAAKQERKAKAPARDDAKLKKAAEESPSNAGKIQEPWKVQKEALKQKFGEQGWQPRKRISPDAIAGVRSLHASDPATYSTGKLAEYFQISPEAVRRILKSKWQPDEKEAVERRERWERRGERKWSEMVEQGVRPPKKWRDMGVGRTAKGELPAWKKPPRAGGGGERWIEQRSPEELFARAAEHSAGSRPQQVPWSDRIL
ncbi:hypothetical protein CAC42_4701 [Sphaceloma murrayae]|uniref:Required for respiratory growth protein 9, mitochondrial n=1 Tax=Sphaceloma murrayae TaxID=2082308 RepID=A0A2K1QNN7_9PEZI|nr:hypothetical protein CAC42_4701 [Sphaceloma murrayae]